ncbi:hypothetical protein [Bradyrhizobium betae]|uniref:hypothetical protein n=1 Tax=Bradyrhizobium betae TaxID=244734 RepID=UPI00100E4775|nr:hypothetical protein [Bradyrhizobium betae]
MKNIVNMLVGLIIIVSVVALIEWAAFGLNFVLDYLYLSIGILSALVMVADVYRSWTQRGTTVRDRFANDFMTRQMFSSTRGIVGIALRLVKEASLRLTYWPLELCLLPVQERVKQAQDRATRGAIALQATPRLPVISASWMLAINLIWLGLWTVFQFKPGSSFQLYITISMYVTIVWFLDFFINPIEKQIRSVGSFPKAVMRYAFVCIVSLFGAVVLIYTYRLTITTNASLSGTVSDVLFAGAYNEEFKGLKERISKSLLGGDFNAAWLSLAKIDRSFIVAMCICALFYLTIVKRVGQIVLGGGALLRRTDAESKLAVGTAVRLGDIQAARQYADELAPDDPLPIMINLREAIDQRDFDRAYGMIDDLTFRLRRQNKSKENVQLDAREKWFALAMQFWQLASGDAVLDFVRWSINRPELEPRDLAKFIVSLSIHSGPAQMMAVSHFLNVTLTNQGARAELFRKEVISRFLISAWDNVSGEPPDPATFETSYLDYLVAIAQTEKAAILLREAPIFHEASQELSDQVFRDFIAQVDPGQWSDASRYSPLKSVDRLYLVDILITLAEVAKGSGTAGGLSISAAIMASKTKLEEGWGGPALERIGIGQTELNRAGPSIGAVLR